MLLAIVLYVAFIFIFLLFFCYFSKESTQNLLDETPVLDVGSSMLGVLIGVFLLLFTTIVMSFYVYPSSFFFGHVCVNNFSYHMFVFIVYTTCIINSLIFGVSAYNVKRVLLVILVNFIIMLLLSILFCINNMFSIIFILDCCNLLLMILLISDLAVDIKDSFSVANRIVSLSVFFWVSYFATMVMLVALLLMLQFLTSLDFSLVFTFLNFSFVWCTINIMYIQATVCLFLGCLLLKAGIFPFFVWKRDAFAAMTFETLFSYMFLYFMFFFFYVVYVIIFFLQFAYPSLVLYFVANVILTIMIVIHCVESGITIKDFFVFSTLYNTSFIFLLILSAML